MPYLFQQTITLMVFLKSCIYPTCISFQKYEKSWSQGREDETKVLQEQVSDEEKAQWSLEGQRLLVQAKRENVALQLEAAYRQRVQSVYQTVKKRLDFQVEKTNIERRIVQKNLVDYVVRKVRAAITPEQEKQNIDKCIADLAALAKQIAVVFISNVLSEVEG